MPGRQKRASTDRMSNAIRWTQEELDAYHGRRRPARPAPAAPEKAEPPREKYRRQKTEQDGIKFDSKKEARRWAQLEQLQAGGVITELRRQVPFVLAPAVRLAGEARMKPALRYFADATYMQGGVLVVEDTKSEATRKLEAFRIKKHLMKTVLGIDIKEI